MSQTYVIKRGKKFYYRRRVPEEVAHLDDRREVKISLKTEDYNDAIRKSFIFNEHIENYWRSLIQSGQSHNTKEKYKAAVQIAKSYGFAYKNTEQIAASQLNEIVNRLSNQLSSKQEAQAILGGVGEPQIKLSECWDLYSPLIVDRLVNKSEHKINKWKKPRETALSDFISVVGDLSINAVDRDTVLLFRNWLNAKIAKGYSGDSANKKLRYVKDILQTVGLNENMGIDYEPFFIKTRFSYVPNSRPPFEACYVEDTLLPKLESLNLRDRMVLYVMADTGMRETEIFGLIKDDIRLDGEIPHVVIQPRKGYELKTRTSERVIPLVGTALYAFKKFPQGFNHKGNPDTFSNIVNNYLTDQNLRPTQEHSAYSLRHTFKDRLRDIEAPEEIIDELMGHRKAGPKYGRGRKLEAKHDYLLKIAYKVPR